MGVMTATALFRSHLVLVQNEGVERLISPLVTLLQSNLHHYNNHREEDKRQRYAKQKRRDGVRFDTS